MKITPYHVIGVSSILAVLVLILYFYQTSPNVTDAPPVATQVVVEEEPAPEVVEEPVLPEIEASAETDMGITLARVRPDGSAVIAGNAPEGSTINIYNEGKLIGSTVATAGNEWVIIPEMPLAAGSHLLTLEIIAPDGTVTIGAMALAIEIPQNGQDTPLVALVPYTDEVVAEAQVLQTPEVLEESAASEEVAETVAEADAEQGATQAVLPPKLTIRSIQALNPGLMSVSGLAQGGAAVTLSVNDKSVAPVRPDDKAMYAATLPIDPNSKTFTLRAVLKDSEGEALATARIKLNRGQVEQTMSNNALIVVQKGDALWRIAYKTYGQGIRYIDIYRQNQSSINNPDLIYPDQVFIVPNG